MIRIEGLSYQVGAKTILENICLTIEKGEFVSLIGPNGAGKSTLMKIILGILKATKGTVTIDGVDHCRWVKKNNFGYVAQKESFDLSFPATVADLVKLGLMKGHLFPPRGASQRMDEALEYVDLKGYQNRFIGELSGGEFQRVLLARAIASNAQYFFLDEPEANVDKKGISLLYTILSRLKSEGKTIVNISHDLQTAFKASDTIACLNRTLHSHNKPELIHADVVEKTFGKVMCLLEKVHV